MAESLTLIAFLCLSIGLLLAKCPDKDERDRNSGKLHCTARHKERGVGGSKGA